MKKLDNYSKGIEFGMRLDVRLPETLMDKLDSLLTCMDRLEQMDAYELMSEDKIDDIRDSITDEFIKEMFYLDVDEDEDD